jgi:hypothetical protein
MKINDNGINRDMTANEVATYKASIKAVELDEKIETEAQAARQVAKDAVLAKLGLTADELAALLGA